MPHYAKNKPMSVQARKVLSKLLKLSSRHAEKIKQNVKGAQSTGYIHSLSTFDKYVGSLKGLGEWSKAHFDIDRIEQITPAMAESYLAERAGSVCQKQLNLDHFVINTALKFDLDKYKSVKPDEMRYQRSFTRESDHRAYTKEQIKLIVDHQQVQNQLATKIAYAAGLRAHELLTLRRSDERSTDQYRTWREDRFFGRLGERYIVTGKGGLVREVLIPKDLAKELEARRLDRARPVVDRNIRYYQIYDINGGVKWSRSFSDTSYRLLTWSQGGHGLRHSYANERMHELQKLGYPNIEALATVSQEMGHWRPEITKAYLR